MNKFKHYIVLVFENFNSKIEINYQEPDTGSYSRGFRNDNGETFIQFANLKNLLIANSTFEHSARHITTWSHHCTIEAANDQFDKYITVFNQID